MKKIGFSILISLLAFSAQAQFADFVTKADDGRTQILKNRQMYPFLHNWNDTHTQQLITKIDSFIRQKQNVAVYNPRSPVNIDGWHARQTIYHASLCLEKALYDKPNEPSGPYSEDYMKRLLNNAKLLNLADETFAAVDAKTFNNFCASAMTADWSLGSCQKAKDTTVRSKEIIGRGAIPMAINILKNDTSLPSKAPVDCAINKSNPEFFVTYNGPVQYTITKPFEKKSVMSYNGFIEKNVGEAIVTSTEAKDSRGQPVQWKTDIVQH